MLNYTVIPARFGPFDDAHGPEGLEGREVKQGTKSSKDATKMKELKSKTTRKHYFERHCRDIRDHDRGVIRLKPHCDVARSSRLL